MELKLHHFAIEVESIDRSLSFYEKLGFRVQTPKTAFPKGFFAYVGNGGDSYLELIEISDVREREKPGVCPHIALESKNLEETIVFLKGNSIEIDDGPHTIPGDVKILGILDPDGYRVEIAEVL